MASTFTDVYPNAAPTIRPQAGKVYRTRDGQKVGPLLQREHAQTYVWIDGNGWTWTAGGYNSTYGPSDLDIVAEWAEPDTRPTIAPAAGKRYLMRNGEGVGPMRFREDDLAYPWIGYIGPGEARMYTNNGTHYANPQYDIVAEVADTPTAEGPVRRRTVTEVSIELGVYGRVRVVAHGTNDVAIQLANRIGELHDRNGGFMNATELRDAAATLSALADALDEMGGAS